MYVSIQELVKGDVITDFKWEVKEDMSAVLGGECVRHGEKIRSARGELGSLDQVETFHSAIVSSGCMF